jgi:hypothetical protein
MVYDVIILKEGNKYFGFVREYSAVCTESRKLNTIKERLHKYMEHYLSRKGLSTDFELNYRMFKEIK